jgi:hypothetical protein
VLGWPRSAGLQQQQQQQQEQLLCPVLQSAFMPSLAGAQAVTVLQDATGEQQQQLGAVCGSIWAGSGQQLGFACLCTELECSAV